MDTVRMSIQKLRSCSFTLFVNMAQIMVSLITLKISNWRVYWPAAGLVDANGMFWVGVYDISTSSMSFLFSGENSASLSLSQSPPCEVDKDIFQGGFAELDISNYQAVFCCQISQT